MLKKIKKSIICILDINFTLIKKNNCFFKVVCYNDNRGEYMKILENEKGFSLVELLAVLVILALLALLAGGTVMRTIKKAESQVTKAQERAILNAAEKWSVDNSDKFDDIEGSKIQIGLDVVFILDVSGSMEFDYNKIYASDGSTKITRTEAAINAIDSAINTLMSNNKDNRIAIVTYGKIVSTFLPLNSYETSSSTYVKYTRNTSGQYGKISTTGLKTSSGSSYSNSYQMQNNVTYTQGGIIGGSKVLKSSANRVNRIPVVILLSDGSPTAYLKGSYNSTCNVSSTCGGSENSDAGYYMIKSALAEKNELQTVYGSQAYFYTIGLGISEDSFGEMVLNPTSENITLGTKKSGNYQTLAKKLKNENGVDAYSYADRAFVGNMDATILKDIFSSITEEVIEATKVTQVCVTVKDLHDGGYLSKEDIDMADGEASSTYVLMNFNEATNQYNFALAKTEQQENDCKKLLEGSA